MRIGIIADDLTGANDSGVQLSRRGLQTSVRFDVSDNDIAAEKAIVLDTDSRSLQQTEAYDRVRRAARFLKENHFPVIYKKIDSTLRGNLGAEADATYDELLPDFVVIAPAYPKNGRKIVSGHLYLHDIPVNETEIANDPKCPVDQSDVGHVFQKQTNRPIGHIYKQDLKNGFDTVKAKMDAFLKAGIPYLLFDSETEEELRAAATFVHQSGYNIVWLGSAGLANYLPDIYHIKDNHSMPAKVNTNASPVLLVAGSVSSVTRKQLEAFLYHERVEGIMVTAALLLSEQTWKTEIAKAAAKAKTAYSKGYHVAIYPTGDKSAVNEAQKLGERLGYEKAEVSTLIVQRLGYLTNLLLNDISFSGIILTGGDTAKQVCTSIGAAGIQLLDEIETGIPLGKLIGRHEIHAVTKAGAFGTEETFIKAAKILQGADL
ncbi:Uncharacterized conserved protein YgbK, DUF1537 family [Evansella caseinilytica]|uniref:Uncharacterized conserved protein YgbK, DUF1537 family n=1 Tax=Evansella caseinilytica TaxID=1503961 RepID=A0A1H3UTF4_9BACI|nr:four-carbon acid sugar kinase family protein [Evansella caseinilytica]SDZ65692.1 Uncharacterized conserved protein YgbK, DUF1537 family [Evansella caseinilytica]